MPNQMLAPTRDQSLMIDSTGKTQEKGFIKAVHSRTEQVDQEIDSKTPTKKKKHRPRGSRGGASKRARQQKALAAAQLEAKLRMMNSNFSTEMLSRPKTTASQQGTNLNKIEGVPKKKVFPNHKQTGSQFSSFHEKRNKIRRNLVLDHEYQDLSAKTNKNYISSEMEQIRYHEYGKLHNLYKQNVHPMQTNSYIAKETYGMQSGYTFSQGNALYHNNNYYPNGTSYNQGNFYQDSMHSKFLVPRIKLIFKMFALSHIFIPFFISDPNPYPHNGNQNKFHNISRPQGYHRQVSHESLSEKSNTVHIPVQDPHQYPSVSMTLGALGTSEVHRISPTTSFSSDTSVEKQQNTHPSQMNRNTYIHKMNIKPSQNADCLRSNFENEHYDSSCLTSIQTQSSLSPPSFLNDVLPSKQNSHSVPYLSIDTRKDSYYPTSNNTVGRAIGTSEIKRKSTLFSYISSESSLFSQSPRSFLMGDKDKKQRIQF